MATTPTATTLAKWASTATKYHLRSWGSLVAAKKGKERARKISIVVFDIDFEPGDGRLTLASVMRQLFANTPAVQFQRDSGTVHQSGDYDDIGRDRFVGQIEKAALATATKAEKDPERGYRFHRSEVSTRVSASVSVFLFDARKRVFLLQERAGLPLTRLETYVRRALAVAPPSYKKITLSFTPRITERPIREWFEYFTKVTSVTVRYRHSQSPGVRAIDKMLDYINAASVHETIRAPQGEGLDTANLLDGKDTTSKAIEHIARNADNGNAVLRGEVDDARIEVDTDKQIERHAISITSDSIVHALEELCDEVAARRATASRKKRKRRGRTGARTSR